MKRIVYSVFSLGCSFLAIFSLYYMISRTVAENGAIDFHSYWYSGHFLRQGIDPFFAYLQQQTPTLPVSYVDGHITVTPPLARPGLATVPANTAPMVLLLSTLSHFSWDLAKFIMLGINLVAMAGAVFLLTSLLPGYRKLNQVSWLLVFLVFMGLFGTRNVIANGQTSMLVFCLMLLAWKWSEKHQIWSGLSLGLAISKYSLALPVFLLLVYRRRWLAIITAGIVQGVGLLIIWMLTGSPPWQIVGSYFRIMKVHTILPGVHLGSLLYDYYSPSMEGALIIVFTVLVGVPLGLWYWKRRRQPYNMVPEPWQDWHLLSIGMLWTLLVAYHRSYDTFTVTLLLGLLLAGLFLEDPWSLSRVGRTWLILLFFASTLYLCLPASSIDRYIARWSVIHSVGMTVLLLILLIINVILLFRMTKQTNHS